jgi:hypothetical protein
MESEWILGRLAWGLWIGFDWLRTETGGSNTVYCNIIFAICIQSTFVIFTEMVGKPEGKRPLGRPRRRREDGIRMDLREIGLGGVDWIRLAQDRDRWRAVVSAVMNLRVLAPRS